MPRDKLNGQGRARLWTQDRGTRTGVSSLLHHLKRWPLIRSRGVVKEAKDILTFHLFFSGSSASSPSLSQQLLRPWVPLEQGPAHGQGQRIPTHSLPGPKPGKGRACSPKGLAKPGGGPGPQQGLHRAEDTRSRWEEVADPHRSGVLMG